VFIIIIITTTNTIIITNITITITTTILSLLHSYMTFALFQAIKEGCVN